jgi:hypothetical protein
MAFSFTPYFADFDEGQAHFFEEAEAQTVVTIADPVPHPPSILNLVAAGTTTRVYFGFLPFLSYVYAIIDNTIHFWRSGQTVSKQIVERDSTFIHAVADGPCDPTRFSETVVGIIAYHCHRCVKILRVTESGIDSHAAITARVRFIVTDILVTNSGRVFIGGDDGGVYQLIHSTVGDDPDGWIDVIRPLNRWRLPVVLFLTSRVEQLVFDETYGILAVLTSNSVVTFYAGPSFRRSVYDTRSGLFRQPRTIILRIAAAWDDSLIRFVGYTDAAERLLFGYNEVSRTCYLAKSLRTAPFPPSGGILTAENLPCGSLFVYDQAVVVTRSLVPLKSSVDPREAFMIADFAPERVLFLAPMRRTVPAAVCAHDALLMHVADHPGAVLVTTAGVRTLRFPLPIQQPGAADGPETVARLLLRAVKMPETRARCFAEIGRKAASQVSGVLCRISRMLAPIFGQFLLSESRGLIEFSRSLPTDLESLCALVREFVTQNSPDYDQLQKILDWVEVLRQELVAVQILMGLRDSNLAHLTSHELFRKVAAGGTPFLHLNVETFHQFLAEVAGNVTRDIRDRLQEKCPSLYGTDIVTLNETVGFLRAATAPEVIARHTKVIISLIRTPLFLDEIASTLVSKDSWRCLVDFCLAKGSVLADPEKRACYRYLFEHLAECIEFVIGSTDRIFLKALYEYCIHKFKSLDRVLLTDSDTLLEFMTAHDRPELWKFHRARRDYLAASRCLFEYETTDPSLFLEEGIAHIEKAAALRAAAVQLELDARTRLLPDCQDKFDTVLMGADALFEQCARRAFWDLAVRLAGEHPARSVLWVNLLREQWAALPAAEAGERLRRLIDDVEPGVIGDVVMTVENFRMNRTWVPGWAVGIWVAARWPLDAVAHAYRAALGDRELDRGVRVEFIAALAYLRRSGAAGDTAAFREWFAENAADRPYFNEVLALL